MSQLAIKGHGTRGKEVIELLEMLGGNNLHGYVADSDCFGFYLGDKTRNIYYDWFYNFEDEDTAIFTLEEFLEKFPYKVGDRVRIPEYESEVRIDKMFWNGNEVIYEVVTDDVTDEVEWYSTNELNEYNEPNNPYKEETIEERKYADLRLDVDQDDKLATEANREMNALDLFKRLPHLNDDKKVIKDWGYTPNLYHFDTKWHVSWMHCDDGFAFIDFEGETAEEAIQKAFDWCVELKLIGNGEEK